MSQVRDPGLQPERTTLSWGRTALTVIVASLAIARNLVTLGHEVAAVATATVGAACLALTRLQDRPWSVPVRVTLTATVTATLCAVEVLRLALA